jgi:uncharacterized protein (DUF58 family)
MIGLKHLSTLVKIYVAIALLVAAVFSPPNLSFIPGVLLVWYLYQWRWPVSAMIDLLTQYFIFFAIALLFSPILPPFLSPLLSIPIMVLLTAGLEKTSPQVRFTKTRRSRRLTPISTALSAIALGALVVSLITSNLALIIASSLVIIYSLVLGIVVYKVFPVKPVREERIQQRILAGKEEHLPVTLEILSRFGSSLQVESNLDWVKVNTRVVSLKGQTASLKIVVTPYLSGPSVIKLDCYAVDRWGIFQTRFEIEPVKLHIIPRARYAAWLAQNYLAGTKPGALPLLSSLGALRSLHGLRQGLEYYGNRPYQPGDSLKNIDWKHSSKYNQLISKEFTEFHGQPAVVLINLEAANAEEADKLAYNIIITALTLGQENIPAALAVYNHEKVVLTTPALSSMQLILRALQTTREIVITANPRKYLNPPDVSRLRANIRRINQVHSQPARALSELLQLEYTNLRSNYKVNPCTRALAEVVSRVNEQSSIVVISQRNHDSEALAFNSFMLAQKGSAVIDVA